jgi:hypothetical protein
MGATQWSCADKCVTKYSFVTRSGRDAIFGLTLREAASTSRAHMGMSSEFSGPADKEELLARIRAEVAAAGGKRLGRKRFLEATGWGKWDLHRFFPNWSEALKAAGFDFDPYSAPIDREKLLADWGAVVRKLRRCPQYTAYHIHGSHAPNTLRHQFGSWNGVVTAFKAFAEGKPEWSDVLEYCALRPPVKAHPRRRPWLRRRLTLPSVAPQRREGRATCGNPLDLPGMRNAPTNEMGVVMLFAMLAERLGFYIEAARKEFPDCEAKRRVGPDEWQTVRIEFEYESRNFHLHEHPPEGCDVIVCWRHNWEECPHDLEVIELRTELERLSANAACIRDVGLGSR